jgi:hypothetical protein
MLPSHERTLTGLLSTGAKMHGQFGLKGASETGPGSVNIPDTQREVNFVCESEHIPCMLESEDDADVWGVGTERSW